MRCGAVGTVYGLKQEEAVPPTGVGRCGGEAEHVLHFLDEKEAARTTSFS